MSMTLNNATVSYRSMSTQDAGYQKKAKNLIADLGEQDENDDSQDSGNNTVTGTATGNVTFDVNNMSHT